MKERIEALHLVALSIDAHKKRGTPEHAEAFRISEEAKQIWKDQIFGKKKCPHCGGELD